MTFPISEAKAAGIVSLTDNATLAQRNSEAQPRIVTHHHPFAKHPFAAPLCFGSSTPLVAPDDASRTQSECRSPGYPIVSAHSLFLTRSYRSITVCAACNMPRILESIHDVQSAALKLSTLSCAESMDTLKHVLPPFRLPAASHPDFAPAGPDHA
ncbi:hypothetical protein CABS03_13024 [Colletotrichum abscissum]|uniref:Uncharacterized protein n=1 Tax=Colletotrichum abscissum TaxID=1671311 RepID=A0A9P9X429_9PEZI|nr:hypothetical protein CABS02_12858 [Colletotrichum abscissum]